MIRIIISTCTALYNSQISFPHMNSSSFFWTWLQQSNLCRLGLLWALPSPRPPGPGSALTVGDAAG